MSDDPRDYAINPEENPDLVWDAEWVVGTPENSGSEAPLNGIPLYLMPDGKIVASKGDVPSTDARIIALKPPPPVEVYTNHLNLPYNDQDDDLYYG